jgi:hypothetical protein
LKFKKYSKLTKKGELLIAGPTWLLKHSALVLVSGDNVQNIKMTIDRIYFRLSTAMVILFVVAIYSFYPRYLGILNMPLPWYMHAHFALMVCWMVLLFAQPVLIRNKNHALHKKLGAASFVIVPLILITSFMMIQLGYHRIITELQQQPSLTIEQIKHQAGKDIGLGFVSYFILLTFYTLAIVYRKRPAFHARFMVAAATSIIGPILDRAIYQLSDLFKMPPLKYEYVGFFLIDIIFLLLVYRDFRRAEPLAPNVTAIIFFVIIQTAYTFFLGTPAWQWLVDVVL